MAFDIAVYVNDHGKTASLNDSGKLVVYRKRQGAWKVCREKEFIPAEASGMSGLRRMMGDFLDFMGECKFFVGHAVTGIPYFELEKSGCTVWEMPDRPGEWLDYILEQEESEQRQENKKPLVAVPVPEEVGAGRFRVSIKEIQDSGGGITSKQVLQPFLRRGKFYELEVFCSHVPPWLEAEFATGVLKGDVVSASNDEIRLIISRRCCLT